MTIPEVGLRSPDGATARVLLDGAQVVSWVPAGATEDRLFVSPRAEYGSGRSVRGGIPICFPQFGPFGALPQHGFARNCRWRVVGEPVAGQVRLALTESELPAAQAELARGAWPHAFEACLDVQVFGETLEVALTVRNTGAAPFAFTAALHPYFAVREATACTVHGLAGLTYRDALRDGAMVPETTETLAIPGPLDRIYYDAPDTLTLRESDRTLQIEKWGFPEAVVWNPGEAGTSSRRDFQPGDERVMLCVEAAVVRTPVTLAVGEQWTGVQRMVAQSGASVAVALS